MARDNQIIISVNGGDRRGAFGGGTVFRSKNSLNSGMYKGKDPSDIAGINLKKVLNIGLAFNTAQKANEAVGAFTENRLQQRRINTAMTFGKYAIGIAINPLAGGIYMASDLGYRSLMYAIDIQKKNREADYYRRLSGNNSFSGRRYRGDYV